MKIKFVAVAVGQVDQLGGRVMSLSEYELKQVEKLREHREKELRRSPRRMLPEAIRDKGNDWLNKAVQNPAAAKARNAGSGAFNAAASGAGKFMNRTAQLTTSDKRVLKAYKKKGHSVNTLDDIRKLDLHAIDRVAAFARLHYAYSLTAAAEGAAVGLVMTGGEAAVAAGGIAGAGAGAAPWLGTIAAAVGADIGAVLAACSRVVAHDALYYGYDPRDPAEEVFMMQVIALALAPTATSKVVAYQQLSKLTRSLATNAAWRHLNEQTLVKVAQKFATGFGQKLTKKKLGQFVPFAGVGVGAFVNWKMVDDVAEAAYWAYRERFLLEKGAEIDPRTIDVESYEEHPGGEGETAIDVIQILESEGIYVGDNLASRGPAEDTTTEDRDSGVSQ